MSSPDATDQGTLAPPLVPPPAGVQVSRPHVTAVLVSHNGARWIPALAQALSASTTQPQRLVVVDTGSTDGSRVLLEDAFGPVIEAEPDTGFGQAVSLAVAHADAVQGRRASPDGAGWLWLLHDDCAPAPDALQQLVAAGTGDDAIAVVGPKLRAWPRAKRLLEVGVSISGTGRRETGLEAGEYDQGQHDDPRDVLAVGSAGMLVRRDVWDRLGGLDPRLPLFRDDVDFGWRANRAGYRVVVQPAAVMFHAEAASRGVRVDTTHGRPHRADREAALFTLLANSSGRRLPFVALRLAVGSLIRSLGFLLGKLPDASYDELAALWAVLARPGRLRQARADRAEHVGRPDEARVRSLRPQWWSPYTAGLDNVLARAVPGHDRAPSGPTQEAAAAARHPLALLRRHAFLATIAALTVAALLAGRGLWGGGLLQGGALLPAPDNAHEWWDLYLQQRHTEGLGSDRPASPYVVVLALLGTVLAGKSGLLVSLIMLLAVPLTAFGAYLAVRRWVEGLGVRVWATVALAVLPVVTGAVQAGRIGTVVATILLPWLFRAAHPLLAEADSRRRARAAFECGLWLAAISAFAPVAWPVAVVLAVGLALVTAFRRRWSELGALVVPVVLPVVILLPWSWQWFTSPTSLLDEAGGFDVAAQSRQVTGWLLPFGRSGVVDAAPWWLTVGLIVAAAVALLRADRRAVVVGWWSLIVVALLACGVLAGRPTEVAGYDGELFAWLGFLVVLAQAGAVMAAATAADGASAQIAGGTFGWRQPLFVATALVALAAPVLGVAWWAASAPSGELVRAPALTLPAYMVDAMEETNRRTLVVASDGADRLAYEVIGGDGERLGDDSVQDLTGRAPTRNLIADLFSTRELDGGRELARHGITYVVLAPPVAPALAGSLDSVPELTRASSPDGALAAWQLTIEPLPGRTADDRSRWWVMVLQLAGVVFLLVLAAPSLQRRTAGGAR